MSKSKSRSKKQRSGGSVDPAPLPEARSLWPPRRLIVSLCSLAAAAAMVRAGLLESVVGGIVDGAVRNIITLILSFSALMSAVMVKVALYVILRMVFDLCGPAQASFWGMPLLLMGAASALLGALRANLETDTKAILACSTIENVGMIAVGLGLALMFRGADMAVPAALALAGALLHVMNHGLFKCLLFLGMGVVLEEAGQRRIDALGGLLQRYGIAIVVLHGDGGMRVERGDRKQCGEEFIHREFRWRFAGCAIR